MTNNDILRRLRYAFDISDSKMIALFASADLEVTREQISDWLKKEEDPAYKVCSDIQLATFLNGFINDKRGKKDGPQHAPEKRLTNNLIFRKLRIALNLTDDGIIQVLSLVKYTVSKHELSSFFRRVDHRQYRECKDQILRNFLHGLQLKHRPDATPAKTKAAPTTVAAEASAPETVPNQAAPSQAAATAEKKDVKPEFKWQKDRAPVKSGAEKNEGGKKAFAWNQAPKPNKTSAEKRETLTAPKKKTKKKGNDKKPAFQWKQD